VVGLLYDRFGQKGRPLRRESHAPPVALEQFEAELDFEAANLLAQCWLRDEQPAGLRGRSAARQQPSRSSADAAASAVKSRAQADMTYLPSGLQPCSMRAVRRVVNLAGLAPSAAPTHVALSAKTPR